MVNGHVSTFRNYYEVYEYLCKPVCEKAGILQGELNILLFLANNPDKDTAMDIHMHAGMKQSMISTLVEKLVQHGYLKREPVPGDRRKVRLVCTENAGPVIEEGKMVLKRLTELVSFGITREDAEVYERVMAQFRKNILDCREKMLKGEL